MTIEPAQIAIIAGSELPALFVIYRLWSKPERPSAVYCLFWSLLLLIPLLGPVFYFLTRQGPAEHPYYSPGSSPDDHSHPGFF